MAKRRHEDGDGAGTSADVAPKRKKKNRSAARVKEQEEVEKLPIPKQEPGEAPSPSEHKEMKTKEAPVAAVVEDDQGKKKKKKNKMMKEVSVTVDDALQVVEEKKNKKKKSKEVSVAEDDDQGKKEKMNKMKEVVTVDAEDDDQGKKKKKKNKMKEVVTVDASHVEGKKRKKMKGVPVTVDDVIQVVEDAQGNKKKEEVPATVDASQVVEYDDQGKKKKKKKKKYKMKEVVSVVASHVVEDDQGKKKKMKEVSGTVDDALQIAEDDQGKKKNKLKEVAPTPVIEDGQGKKKKKNSVPTLDGQGKEKEVVTLEVPQTEGKKKRKDPSHVKKEVVTLEDVVDGQGKKKKRKVITSQDPGTGAVKKTILKSQSSSDGAELDSKRKKKQVTFQLPDRFEEKEELLSGAGDVDFLEELTWKEDRLRPGLIYGMYTPEEDGVLKKAIFDYIQQQGWDREEGLEKILNSKKSGARGCWHVIRKCLPQRELKRIHSRAHRLLGPNILLGKWSDAESRSLMELQALHGNDWKRIATVVGRDPEACKDKWRQLKWTRSQDYKRGTWSEEEHQKLCQLVLKCLHVKALMKKKGLYTYTHKLLREDISWEYIAGQMGGRSRCDCMQQWYRRMASPMVTTGEWSSFDDQRLLERLMEEFPLSEELVEWDSLLEHRSGETCKKRWEQMQRTLGRSPEVRHKHFLEKLESIMKRFAPHLLDPEYDQKFADDMQRADEEEESDDADKSDDNADV